MVVELFLMGTSGYRISVVARKGVQNLTVGESHLLLLWLISISRECCSKKSVEYLPCNANLGLYWWWGRLLVGCSSFHLFIFTIGIGGVVGGVAC